MLTTAPGGGVESYDSSYGTTPTPGTYSSPSTSSDRGIRASLLIQAKPSGTDLDQPLNKRVLPTWIQAVSLHPSRLPNISKGQKGKKKNSIQVSQPYDAWLLLREPRFQNS